MITTIQKLNFDKFKVNDNQVQCDFKFAYSQNWWRALKWQVVHKAYQKSFVNSGHLILLRRLKV